jgi:exonuclease I
MLLLGMEQSTEEKRNRSKRSIVTGLNAQEEEFCQLVVDGYTNKEAYIKSHGVGNAKPKTITEKASRLSRTYNVEARIEILRKEQAERSAIKRDWIVDKLKEIVEVGTERTQVTEVKSKGKDEVVIKYLEKMVDSAGANSSLDKLIRMAGFYAAEKSETEVKTRGKYVLNLQPRTDK